MKERGISEISNASWIIGCKLIKAVLTLVITAIVSRYLGVENYGLLGYAGSLVAFAAPILRLGIDSVMVYELVDKPDKEGESIGSAILLNFLSSFVCIIGIIAFVFIANRGETDTIVVCAIYAVSLIFQAGEIVQYWYQSKLISKVSTIIMLVSYIVISLAQLLMVYYRLNVYWFALSYSIDYVIMAALLLLVYKRMGIQKISFSWQRAKELLKLGRFYIVSGLMVTIFAQTDTIMIKLMLGDEATGFYRAAVTCAGMVGFVFAAIIDSMRPSIFKAAKNNFETFDKRMTQLYAIIIYFSLTVSALITIGAPIIVNILYGSKFSDSVEVLRLVVWYTTFSYLGAVRNVWMLSKNQQKYLWIINLSGALLNVVLNLFLIKFWGIMGAALASLITQIFANVILGFIIKPLRANNVLMIKGCNPACLVGVCKAISNVFKRKKTSHDESINNNAEEELISLSLEELKATQLSILKKVDEFCEKNEIKYWLDCGTLIGCVRHKGYIPWDDDIDIGMLREDYDKFMQLFNAENTKFQFKSYENDKQFNFAYGKVLDTETVLYEPDENGKKLCVNIDVFPYDNVPGPTSRKVKKLIKIRNRCNICEVAKNRQGKPRGGVFRRMAVYMLQAWVKLSPRDKYIKKLVKNAATFKTLDTEYVADLTGNSTNLICSKALFAQVIDAEFEGHTFKIPKEYDSVLRMTYGDYMQLPPEEDRIAHHLYKAYIKINKTDN